MVNERGNKAFNRVKAHARLAMMKIDKTGLINVAIRRLTGAGGGLEIVGLLLSAANFFCSFFWLFAVPDVAQGHPLHGK
ncbi:hypothetical protein ACIP01_03920 [Pseudomonas monteilii]|uniref:hypothetical protein n=1 Tax=Pseudomonas monteilii TaxID=76759 RepID=UPI0037F934A1